MPAIPAVFRRLRELRQERASFQASAMVNAPAHFANQTALMRYELEQIRAVNQQLIDNWRLAAERLDFVTARHNEIMYALRDAGLMSLTSSTTH